jgi:hypothetical protein
MNSMKDVPAPGSATVMPKGNKPHRGIAMLHYKHTTNQSSTSEAFSPALGHALQLWPKNASFYAACTFQSIMWPPHF